MQLNSLPLTIQIYQEREREKKNNINSQKSISQNIVLKLNETVLKSDKNISVFHNTQRQTSFGLNDDTK